VAIDLGVFDTYTNISYAWLAGENRGSTGNNKMEKVGERGKRFILKGSENGR
jgi:hypothetical protein